MIQSWLIFLVFGLVALGCDDIDAPLDTNVASLALPSEKPLPASNVASLAIPGEIQQPASNVASLAFPGEIPLPDTISSRTKSHFNLFMDTDLANKVIYFVPNSGLLSTDVPRDGGDPSPRLMVSSHTPRRGYFAGQELLYIGGAMSTLGAQSHLLDLEREAHQSGYRIEPAPVVRTVSTFAVAARTVDGDGRFEVECKDQMLGTRADGSAISAPRCRVRGDRTGSFDVDTEFALRIYSHPFSGSTINGVVPFQIISTPGWTSNIEQRLRAGAPWDDLVRGVIDWNMEGGHLTHKAVVHLRWEKVFEQAKAFLSVRHFVGFKGEVSAFFRKLTECDDEQECGITVEWFDQHGKPRNQPDTEVELINAVRAIEDELRDELFQRLVVDDIALPAFDPSKALQWTLRLNFHRRFQSIREKREVFYNPGRSVVKAMTTFTVDCVKGDIGSALRWNMQKSSCKDLLDL